MTKTFITPEQLKEVIAKSTLEESNVDPEVLTINGMSSVKNRHLLNNIVGLLGKDASILEVGSWRGSTASAMMSNNEFKQMVLVDNISEFIQENVKEDLLANIEKFGKDKKVKFVELDFFEIPKAKMMNKFDMVFYDGNHSAESQAKAIKNYFN